jgi:hypothetical protein
MAQGTTSFITKKSVAITYDTTTMFIYFETFPGVSLSSFNSIGQAQHYGGRHYLILKGNVC